MKFMYMTTKSYEPKIEPVKVVSETSHFVTVEYKNWEGEKFTRREKKDSAYQMYFETWEEAHSFLMHQAAGNVNNAVIRLDEAKRELKRIQDMEAP